MDGAVVGLHRRRCRGGRPAPVQSGASGIAPQRPRSPLSRRLGEHTWPGDRLPGMSISTADAPLIRHTNDELSAAAARRHPRRAHGPFRAITADILAIPESALERDWAWIGGGEGDVRYGLYRLHELFERAEIEACDSSGGPQAPTAAWRPPSSARLPRPAGTSTASWRPLTDIDDRRRPGGGEWTIRLTLGHTVNSQRAYGWSTAWWQERGFALDDPDLPTRVSEELFDDLPDEETAEAAGSLDDIRARLDEILDLSAERLAGTAGRSAGPRSSLVRVRGPGLVPAGPLVEPHPRAHDPGREDPRDARPQTDGAGATRPPHPRGLRSGGGRRVRPARRRCRRGRHPCGSRLKPARRIADARRAAEA